MVAAGAIPVLVQLLSSPHEEVCEQAGWVLSNIAGEDSESRDAVLDADALPPLLELCAPDAKLPLLRITAWLLQNLCGSVTQCQCGLDS